MTVKSINTLKNYPVYVQAHKARYNYVDEVYSSDVSKTFNITLKRFEGLDYDINDDIIDTTQPRSISVITYDKQLWNKQQYYGTSHVLAPIGNKYLVQKRVFDNFKKRGTGGVIDEHGVLSNITSDNNIYTKLYPQSTNWSIHTVIHTPTNFTDESYFFGNYSTNRATPQMCTDASGNLKLYAASSTGSWNIANGTIVGAVTPDATHSVDLIYDGTKYTVKIDDVVTWELESSLNQYFENSEQFCIGYDSGNKAWTGSINLLNTYIKVNGEIYWKPYRVTGGVQKGCLDTGLTDVVQEKTYTAFVKLEGDLLLSESDEDKDGYIWANTVTVPRHIRESNPYIANFDIVGTGISIDDCIASGFNESSWIVTDAKIPSTVLFTPDALRFISRFKCPSDVSSGQGLWRFTTTNSYITWAGIRDNDAVIWSNGFSIGSTDLLSGKAGKYFWMQVILDSTGIKVYVLESDATSFEELPTDLSQWQLNTQKSEDIRNKITKIEMGYAATSEYWRGGVDLLNTRIDGTGPVDVTGEKTWSLIWKPIVIT